MNKQAILVVDDNPDNQVLTQILLECEGYQVRIAADATQTLETLETYRPAMILMDLQLPGIDGLTLTRYLRRDPALQAVVIVALTAYAMTGDRENAREAGCDGYITKPIDTRTFGGTISGFFGPSPVRTACWYLDR